MVKGVLVVSMFVSLTLAVACGSEGAAPPNADAGVTFGDDPRTGADAGADGSTKTEVDGGFVTDGGVLPAARFATRVVEVKPGECAGFGVSAMPGVVLGPPEGAGNGQGGLDVLSLGVGGSIVLSFEADPIVDGPGPDFLVFENAFYVGNDPSRPFAELATVSVSDDGVTFREFPCTAKASDPAPYGACAGWRPVRASSTNGLSPFDPEAGGGDPFDLADLGVSRARFVKIVDRGEGTCAAPPAEKLTTAGFDLDAVASIHHEKM